MNFISIYYFILEFLDFQTFSHNYEQRIKVLWDVIEWLVIPDILRHHSAFIIMG
jgi:hypothetical protein